MGTFLRLNLGLLSLAFGFMVHAQSATVIAAKGANLRAGNSTTAKVVGGVGNGKTVTITGEAGGWYQVRYGSHVGYMAKSVLRTTATPSQATATTPAAPTAPSPSNQTVRVYTGKNGSNIHAARMQYEQQFRPQSGGQDRNARLAPQGAATPTAHQRNQNTATTSPTRTPPTATTPTAARPQRELDLPLNTSNRLLVAITGA